MKPLQFIEKRSDKNSKVAYSKLKLLGNYLAEEHSGQGTFPGMADSKPKKKRKKSRLGKRKKKKIKDAPGQQIFRFKKKEKPPTEVEKQQTAALQKTAKATKATQKSTETATGRQHTYGRAGIGLLTYSAAQRKVKGAIRLVTRRRRRRPTGPNPLTGGTEGAAGVKT